MISKQKCSGFTLIEVVLALAIMAGMMAGLSWTANQYTSGIKKQAAAQYMIRWISAADQYVKDNSAALAVTATPTVPATITTANLIAANLLPISTSTTNPYGQTVCAKVLEPSANVLTALVVSNGGTAIGNIDAGEIAASIGPNGGYTATTTPTTASGSYGGWSISTVDYKDCSGVATTAGHLMGALFFNNTKVLGDYIYRSAVAGHPEANTMTTPLIMSATQVVGTACATTGAIAQDGTGAVISCQSGTWRSMGSAYWQDPVANFASLPVCNVAAKWQTRIVGVPTVGTQPRAYSCDGAIWTALGVDDVGDSLQAGTATMANAVITGTAVIGVACAPNGKVAQDGTGLLLSCQSGVWAKAQGAGGTGISGILAPLAGKSIMASCWGGTYTGFGYAFVDASGNPFTKADSGPWVAGFSANNGASTFVSWSFNSFPSLHVYISAISDDPQVGCSSTANWPMI